MHVVTVLLLSSRVGYCILLLMSTVDNSGYYIIVIIKTWEWETILD